jgi:hypothetical protein
MRFGNEASPRIYTWGNPGVPSTTGSSNAVLAVARATEGGKFSRNYVPMADASSTDPVVAQVVFPQDELDKTTFKSLDVHRDLSSIIRAVMAIDRAGRMWTWGMDMTQRTPGQPATVRDDATGLGGPNIAFGSTQALMHRPVRVLMPSERGGHTVAWSKVQCRTGPLYSVAQTEDGKLYGAGILNDRLFLDTPRLTGSESSTSAVFFVPLSTQTWNDFALLDESLYAIRNDGTLHTKESTGLFSGYTQTQVKGFLLDARHASKCVINTSAAVILSYTIGNAPAGGVQATVSVAKDTATGECRTFLSNCGLNYTAVPSSTRSLLASTETTPTLQLQLANDTGWQSIYSNQRSAVLFNSGEGTNVGSAYIFNPSGTLHRSSVPDDGFLERNSTGSPRIFDIARPSRVSTELIQEVVDASGCSISFRSLRPATVPDDFALTLPQGLLHSNLSNVITWGQNKDGCLAVGHTNRQRTLAFVASPDTAEFTVSALSLGGDYSLAIRVGSNMPGSPSGFQSSHLYCAGRTAFAGNSAATSSMTTFTMCGPESVNKNPLTQNGAGRHWYSAFAFSVIDWQNNQGVGRQQFSVASRDYRQESSAPEPLT